MKSEEPFSPRDPKRPVILSLLIFLLFSLLIVRFFNIQVLEGEKWAKQAERQHYFFVKEPFMRGTFYSNPHPKKGHPPRYRQMAIDVPQFHLYADPKSIPAVHKDEIIENLTRNIASADSIVPGGIREQLDKQTRSRRLAKWLDRETRENILAWWSGYARLHKIPRNAIFFVKDFRRSYPCGKLAGQVLHTIQSQKDEKTDRSLPTGGLELYFNRFLEGKQGKKRLMRSPSNSLETGEVIALPENGADIYLTINTCLQAIAEDEIEKGVKRSKAKCGWALMMDPQTGEILALAQYPFFNPSDYRQYFNDPALIENTKVKAVTDANEPGSVFKPFTVAMALKANRKLRKKGEKELFSPDERIATSSGRFPGRSKPISDTSPSLFMNLDMGMQKSSNIYMGRLAERIIARLGNDWYRRQLQLFGFGVKTGIELPAESSGLLPSPGKLHPNGSLEWSIPTPFSLAIGHNMQANTVQLARAYAVLANGGFLVRPTLIRRIVKKNGDGQSEVLPDHSLDDRFNRFPRILDKEIVDRVVRSMRYVTKPGGTAIRADVPGYTEAGKTSTPKKIVNGKYSEVLYCPTFAGFAPATNPAFVLVIVMDEPEYKYTPGLGKNHNGGNCTATVFREIAKRTLEYLGISPDDPHGYPYGDPRYDPAKVEWMKETKELQEIYQKWNKIPPTKPK